MDIGPNQPRVPPGVILAASLHFFEFALMLPQVCIHPLSPLPQYTLSRRPASQRARLVAGASPGGAWAFPPRGFTRGRSSTRALPSRLVPKMEHSAASFSVLAWQSSPPKSSRRSISSNKTRGNITKHCPGVSNSRVSGPVIFSF